MPRGHGMIERMRERVVAACDGASKGNPGPAAWAWVVSDDKESPARWEAGPLGKATNNVAELTALERLLTATAPDVPLEIRMDSQYAMKAVTTWLPGWKRNGWKTSDKKPVKNIDLWQRLDAALAHHMLHWHWVRGHAGHDLNERADELARAAIAEMRAAGQV